MGRTVKDPNRRLPKPVQKVWLSEKNVGRRILLVVLLLAIGSGFLVYGFMNFLHGDSGWREISVKAGADLNCGEDFTLKYNVGASGVSAGGEAKALSLLYTDAAVKGYRLFNIDESFEDVTNLYDINQHPNEVLTVDPVLYDALKKVSDANCREIYLGRCMRPWKISAPAMMMRLQRSLIRTGTMRHQKKRQQLLPLHRTRMIFHWSCQGKTRSVCMCQTRIRRMPQRWAIPHISTFSG
mgnify:FL=1